MSGAEQTVVVDKQQTHAMMIDLETLGTHAGCVVTEIAAVVFDTESGEPAMDEVFSVNLNVDSQVAKGATIDNATVGWWTQQDKNKLDAMMAEPGDAEEQLHEFIEFCQRIDCSTLSGVWCQGMDFDLPILRAALERFDLHVPWGHWLGRDTRTVYAEAGFAYQYAPRAGVHHNALDDCLTQVNHLKEARKKLFRDTVHKVKQAEAAIICYG